MDGNSTVHGLRRKDALATNLPYRVGPGFDSTEHRVAEPAATLAANDHHDALTGLPTPTHLAGTFHRLRRRAQRRNEALALSHAIENGGLTLHYQPQFEVHGGRACGVEALARWCRANGDATEPNVFIPLAEQTGLIGALGTWVLQEACKRVAGWHIPGEPAPTVCVNVSTHQIDESMCAVIRRTVERAGILPDQLELEITEGSLMRNPEAVLECVRQWKEFGVRIAIDDFGTGYSSLSYLSKLPVDRLKLDRSLIHNLTSTRKDAVIVGSIIALGKDLGVSVIAEGVETEQQFHMLQDLGCLQVQGYLLARPAPPEDVQALLASRWGMRQLPSQVRNSARLPCARHLHSTHGQAWRAAQFACHRM
jgi:EAL domain-containing protein (putative c-di-GMP-specific phosphodiesterase class I)